MITDINQTNVRNELGDDSLADYWQGYFHFRDDASDLYEITRISLLEIIERAKNIRRPFIDSSQVIGEILTALGPQHSFHRQFNEQFPGLHPNQTLGMQLYDLMLHDEDIWVYTETQHADHLFPHATYFIPQEQNPTNT